MSKREVEFCGFSFLRNEDGFPTIELRVQNTDELRKRLDELENYDKADELIEAVNYVQQRLAELSNELEDRYGVI